MNNIEYYAVQSRDADDDWEATPELAWESDENEPTLYMMAARFLHGMYDVRSSQPYFRLDNPRSIKNPDGNIVTIHDVSYIDTNTGESIDTLGYILVWSE